MSKPLTKRQRTMLDRLAKKPDRGIDFSDIPKLTDEQLAAAVRLRDRPRTTLISVRLRNDVLEWLKSKGPGHLTRVNDILTNVMEAERRLKSA
ncbi:MAG TPA: BrnA antitoxin family protein [Bryobacteraceae bacterium]